jgi:FkbM family methyltransferase
MRLFTEKLRPGMVFYDIGAQAGYFTLLASSLVGPAGRVIAFEPAPRNIHYLRQHVDMHGLGNVDIEEAAVAGESGVRYFDTGPSFVAGRLCETGSIPVRTLGLDEEIQAGRLPVPQFLKIDVEGAELEVLCGAEWLLAHHAPQIALDIHSFLGPSFAHLEGGCRQLLVRHGYRLERLGSHDVYAWRPNP